MKKPIFIGAIGCGKTTLCQRLQGKAITYNKTQVIQYYQNKNLIDTPGEFMEHRNLYSALMTTSVDSDIVVFLQSVIDKRQSFAPGFGSMFTKEKIGVVTKIDLSNTPEDIDWAAQQLKSAGAEQIFKVSAKNNIGVEELSQYLEII